MWLELILVRLANAFIIRTSALSMDGIKCSHYRAVMDWKQCTHRCRGPEFIYLFSCSCFSRTWLPAYPRPMWENKHESLKVRSPQSLLPAAPSFLSLHSQVIPCGHSDEINLFIWWFMLYADRHWYKDKTWEIWDWMETSSQATEGQAEFSRVWQHVEIIQIWEWCHLPETSAVKCFSSTVFFLISPFSVSALFYFYWID